MNDLIKQATLVSLKNIVQFSFWEYFTKQKSNFHSKWRHLPDLNY